MAVHPELVPILNKLQGVKFKSNGGLTAICPSHDDHSPSLSVDYRDGHILLKCMALTGCTTESILNAIHLEMSDLFTDEGIQTTTLSSRTSETVLRRPSAPLVGKGTKVYNIVLDDGEILHHIRTDYTDGSKKFSWERNGKPGLGGLSTVDLPLYCWWAFIQARRLTLSQAPFVILVEGETACEALIDKGYIALGTYGADTIPSVARLKELRGLAVFLWCDEDPVSKQGVRPGWVHMDKIAKILTELGNPPLILHWKEAPPKGDAADYIAAGLDVDDLLSEGQLWENSHIYKASQPVPNLSKEQEFLTKTKIF